MRYFVLGIGYREAERDAVQAEWESYGLEFDFVDSFPLAIQQFTNKDYACVAICSDTLFPEGIELLSGIKPISIVVLSSKSALCSGRNICAMELCSTLWILQIATMTNRSNERIFNAVWISPANKKRSLRSLQRRTSTSAKNIEW